ncbi:uncharacterized protein TM35_000022390 [Trypanosoma theileri]|uniref:Uncharacterized protein n=1 Tax=Trypanosoma theileri TaxID=67003 RepID=A0A1X0P8G4_9TRYP|nr:uncharacterized protein TM35_000022390 [Trypanosoma theileri]ORC92913.1 hypothetical protein TM35_000022390 [Trypanosoma theileri]
MAGESQTTRQLQAYWRQMLTNSFKDSPDERLQVYTWLSNVPYDGNKLCSDLWVLAMLKAVQDPWSRVRKLGRESLLAEVTAAAVTPNKMVIRRLVGLLFYKWPRLQHWYEKEGMLKLWEGLVLCTPCVNEDVGVLSHLLLNVVLQSFSDPQFPVREVAVGIALQIAKRSKELASFIMDYIFAKFRVFLKKSEESEVIMQIDGFLDCFAKLLVIRSESNLNLWWVKIQPILQQFAHHSAASIRQRVAEVWTIQSEECFKMLLDGIIKMVQTPSQDDEWWRMVETLLMALQKQLERYLSFPKKVTKLGFQAKLQISDSLHAILVFAEAKQFEVARMGKQVLPLLIQFWVRFAPSLSFVKECCSKSAVRFQEREYFSVLFLPEIIWFLTLRRYIQPKTEVKEVKDVVSQYVLTLFEKNIGTPLELKSEKENILPLTRSGVSLSILLLCTYFPECCNDSVDDNGGTIMNMALSKELWEKTLEEDANNVKYAVDFSLVVRQSGGTVMHLVPTWLHWFSSACAHQQCLILEAVKIAIGAKKHWISHKFFSFAYHSTFDAPTMQDGGEDISRGFHWLKEYYPSESLLPEISSTVLSNNDSRLSNITEYLHTLVYNKVFMSKGAEPSVLHIIRSVMLVECEEDPTEKTMVCIVSAIISRLENVTPNWRDTLLTLNSEENNDFGTITSCEINSDGGCSDWDESDSDSGVGVIAIEEEIKEARAQLAAIIRICFARDQGKLLEVAWPKDVRKGIELLCGV